MRLISRLPVWVRVQPLDVMCVLLGIPSGISALAGIARSAALAELLPWWATKLWAACLLLGCVAWAAGITSMREHEGHLVITRLPAMILGLRLISIDTLVYAVALVVVNGWASTLAAWPMMVVAAGTALQRLELVNRSRRPR